MGETDWRGNWVLFWWAGPCSVRLVLGSFKMSRSLHPPTRILKVYIDLTGFSHMFSPDSLNHTLVSYGFSFGKGFHCGDRGENIYSRIGEGVRILWLSQSSSMISLQSCPLIDLQGHCLQAVCIPIQGCNHKSWEGQVSGTLWRTCKQICVPLLLTRLCSEHWNES